MIATLKTLAPQVLAAIVRRYGDFAAAEDAVQEALLAAATRWPAEGRPDHPRGWLVQVAARRMIDHIRAERARRRREEVAFPEELTVEIDEPGAPKGDDTLALLFMCCHPALTNASALALTLRAVGGLTTAEIAAAFFVPEATMAQRISRAKERIRESGVPFAVPAEAERAARLGTVLHVLYLIFNEGYTSTRDELAREAIRLMRHVHAALAGEPEVAGLLALMLLTDARRAARTGPGGALVALTEQDRGAWDHAAIAEGTALVTAAFARGAVGPYQLQAAIAAVHDEAATAAATDWPQILALYRVLERMTPNPMITLNRIVAGAMVHGPAPALADLAALDDPRIADHHRVHAVRAHLLELAGDAAGAIASYRAAAARTTSIPERDYLIARAAKL